MENIISGQSFNGKMDSLEFEERFQKAEKCYKEFLEALGYDVDNDSNMKDTPRRYTKVMMKEICKGTYVGEPKITAFENIQKYDGVVFSGPIEIKSVCSHHILPFYGYAYIAYIPKAEGKIIGLSKLSRIAKWFAARPQLQEQLTQQIHNYLVSKIGDCHGVAVLIKAKHTCVALRGTEDMDSVMQTSKLSGAFLDNADRARDEFYMMVDNSNKSVK